MFRATKTRSNLIRGEIMNKIDLNNRTAIVTGGAQGFGLAITNRFLESGANVIIWDIDTKIVQNVLDQKNWLLLLKYFLVRLLHKHKDYFHLH